MSSASVPRVVPFAVVRGAGDTVCRAAYKHAFGHRSRGTRGGIPTALRSAAARSPFYADPEAGSQAGRRNVIFVRPRSCAMVDTCYP